MPREKKSGKPRKGKSKRKAKAKATDESQEMISGALARLVPGEVEGNQKIQPEALGGVKPTELPTLFRMAAKQAEEMLGIE